MSCTETCGDKAGAKDYAEAFQLSGALVRAPALVRGVSLPRNECGGSLGWDNANHPHGSRP